MKKTNTTMKKLIAMMMIIAVLAGLVACGAAEPNGTTNATDSEQMQASGNAPTTEGDKPGENSTGQPVDGTSGTSEAADPSTSADPTTEPDTEKTEPSEPGTQPTQPTETQPTQPTQPQPTDPPHQHSYTATVVAPTCNDKGYTKHTCACGDSYNDNYTDALGHHFIDEVVAPTSTEQGYTKHTCDRCWYSYKDSYTDPVKQVYDAAQAQQVGNNYIASLGYTVDESLVWSTHGYYPPRVLSGFDLDLMGGQEWFNNRAIECVQATVDILFATANPGDDVSNYRFFCSVTYDDSTDKYRITVYYG